MKIEVQEGSEGSEEDSLTEEDIETLLKRLQETVRLCWLWHAAII